MKLLLDFLPIILFFGVFKYAEGNAVWAADFATQNFGFLVSGGVVGPKEAPVLLSTIVVIAATALQIVWIKLKGKRVDAMLWISFVLVAVLGGATIFFHNEDFIKWKPTGLYWAAGIGLVLAQWIFKKNGIKALMGSQLELPASIWAKLNTAWALFFLAMGCLNLWVAYNFSTATWVNFKLFGIMGMMLVFAVGQAFFISKYLPTQATETEKLDG
jgi:intracellular septation protein